MAEARPGRSAVDARGFVELEGNGLQPREHGKRHEGRELPDAHDDQRRHDVVHAQPRDGLPHDSPRHEEVVHEAKGLVEQPAPHDDGDDGRDHVGKQHEGPHGGAATEGPVEHERRSDAEHQLKRRRTGGVHRSLPEAVPEFRVAHEPDIVAEADPALLREEGMLVEE